MEKVNAFDYILNHINFNSLFNCIYIFNYDNFVLDIATNFSKKQTDKKNISLGIIFLLFVFMYFWYSSTTQYLFNTTILNVQNIIQGLTFIIYKGVSVPSSGVIVWRITVYLY